MNVKVEVNGVETEAKQDNPVPMTQTELTETLAKQFRILSERSASSLVSTMELEALTNSMLEVAGTLMNRIPSRL